MKKSFSNAVSDLLKSLTGGNQKDDEDEINKGCKSVKKADVDEDDIDLDDEDIDLDDEDDTDKGDEEKEDEEDKDEAKEEDEDMVDGGEVLKALDATLATLAKSQRATQKRIDDLGEAVVGLAEMISAIGNQQIPPRTVLNKSMNGSKDNAVNQNLSARPTEEDLYNVQLVLKKAVDEGEIDIIQSSMISSDFQKCMNTGRAMNPKYYEFLQARLNKGAK